MPSVLFDRIGLFFSSFNPDSITKVRVNRIPVKQETEARLALRINVTEDELCKTRRQLEDEKTRSRKWERRAVVASADLASAKGRTDVMDRLQKTLKLLEHDKTELQHRVTRLSRMLTVAEEQRGVAIARLAGFAGGIEDVQEQNRILRGTVNALQDEIESVKECWQADVDEMEMELREWESREIAHMERVNTLEGKLDDLAIEKRKVDENLCTAQSQLLDVEADRCLVNVLGAEKARLTEQIEELSQTAEKVPGLEENNQQLQAEIREGKRRLEGMSKVLVTMKMKNVKLAVHAREKEQYGESMAQMFQDMKKECERLRHERDEKARLWEDMVETHDDFRLKQEEAIAAFQAELGNKNKEAAVYETNLKQLRTEYEENESMMREYFHCYSRIAGFLNIIVAFDGTLPDLGTLESTILTLQSKTRNSESEITALQNELDLLRKENQSKEESVESLSVEIIQAKQAHTEMKERIDAVQDDNVRLRDRSATFEAEVNKLTKSSEALDRRMDELVVENDILERKLAPIASASEKLKGERDALLAEMKSIQTAAASEREELASQLETRSSSFAALEKELKEVREAYQSTAKDFETQRLSLNRRLNASEERKEAAEQDLVRNDCLVKDTATRVDELTTRCQQLEAENDGLKEAGDMRVFCDDVGDILVLREMLLESENERERLTAVVNELQQVPVERRLSSSSVSSDEDMARRVEELEMTLEEKAKEKEAQKQQLCEAERYREILERQVTDLEMRAKQKEREAEKLRGEMTSIYSRMRKMACASLPAGAEELLEEEDIRRLKEIREATRREENDRAERVTRDGVRESRKLPAQKRKVRMGVVDNKTRVRM